MASHRTTARALLLLLVVGVFTGTANAAVNVPDITAFPVAGDVTYIDDFGAPRPQGPHEGNDIMSVRHQPAIAFEAGWVEKWADANQTVPSCMLVLHGKSGFEYWYIHLNNDQGLENDNKAGCRKAYAPGLDNHDHVTKGQLVGFVGDSGDANGIQSHLHFEVHRPSGRPVDPFTYLNKAKRLLFPKLRPGLGDLTVTLKRATVVSTTSSTITVKTKRIVIGPLGLSYLLAQKVTLDASGAAVERKSASGVTAATVSSAKAGEKARLKTPAFTPTWAMQRGNAGALSISEVILLG